MRTMISLALLLSSGAALAQAPGFAPAFTPVQPETFSVPGSLSNAWADFDNDGDPDLAVSLKGGEIRLYRNDAGVFTNIGPAMGLPGADEGEYRGLSWGDYDNDGKLDLFAGSSLPKRPSHLFRNLGDRFENVAPALGLTLLGRSSRQNNFVDIDGDGDLDLFITDRMGGNKLFRNDGGSFVQIHADAPISAARSTVGACWLDYDQDGDLDLFLANQSGKEDSLFRNDGSGFTDVAAALGINSPGRDRSEGGVGCAIGDYDNDGLLDIFVPNYGKNALWRGQPGGRFVAAAAATGVDVDNHAVGAAFGDFDNDGFIDLSVMSYHGEPGKQVPENRLFRNEGGKRFVNVLGADSPLDTGDHGTAFVDYNGDGALDLSITKGYNVTGGHYLFRNDLAPAKAGQSLQVIVLDSKGHHTQAGAEVRIYPAGRKGAAPLGLMPVHTGGGYGTQHALPVHFGLGNAKRVDVEVTFMGKNGREVQWRRGVTPSATPIVIRRAAPR
ncbi:hypothetical protein FHS79_003599 [Polymorphobacter multimanifer]|uniref:ASPIC/UnbV domain-containing protein n=1 Tax=Polymorphobacter multimanifer TaxID=1070431 RepID=A0A841LK99_9SPHN|nr:CRTAC1 family protein [Polymorphobacter multimanifer]MBB6229398.1 hypothetical protein [Polymorphobacter multimanifer]